MTETVEVVICGAGIAGVSAAYHLTQAGVGRVLLIESAEPLGLTSDKSTECYRNYWPGMGDGMAGLMKRSLDLLDALAWESGNAFHLNRRGYLYCTSDPACLKTLWRSAEQSSALGAGAARIHPGAPEAYRPSGPDSPADGFDLLTDPELLRTHYPWLDVHLLGALHVRRAGWLSAQQLGRLMLDRARNHGARLLRGQVEAVTTRGGLEESVRVASSDGSLRIDTPLFLNAAGPWLARVARLLRVDLPVYCEVHAKVAFTDSARILPRTAPLTILSDAQTVTWTDEERLALRGAGRDRLLGELPSGLHTRPEGPDGSPILLALWPYGTPLQAPAFPLTFDPMYAEVVLRGLERLIPAARLYRERLSRAFVDGGYYTRTRENLPRIGPLGPAGANVIGALSGFGIMAALGAGELLACHVTHTALPRYAGWFMPTRSTDPAYQAVLASLDPQTQL